MAPTHQSLSYSSKFEIINYMVEKFRAKPEDWKRLTDANTAYLKLFFSNVDYLCTTRYNGRPKAVEALRKSGFSGQEDSIYKYKRGDYTRSTLLNLLKWCLLFNEPLEKMLSVDYTLLKN